MVEGVAAVCGAQFTVEVDGQPAPLWESFTVPQGGSLTVGSARARLLEYTILRSGAARAAALVMSRLTKMLPIFPRSMLRCGPGSQDQNSVIPSQTPN